MSTKTQTDTTNAYNGASMGNYNMFQGSLANNLNQMVNNPLGNSFFKNQLAQQMGFVNQVGARNNSNYLSNLRSGGGILSNAGGLVAAGLNRTGIANSLGQSNAFNTALNNALQTRNAGLSMQQAYQPLQTGQTSSQTKSGLGTWLPQVLGAGLNMAMPGLGSLLGGGSFAAGYGGGSGGGGGFMTQQIPSGSSPFAPPPAFSGSWMQGFGNAVQSPYGGAAYGGR